MLVINELHFEYVISSCFHIVRVADVGLLVSIHDLEMRSGASLVYCWLMEQEAVVPLTNKNLLNIWLISKRCTRASRV